MVRRRVENTRALRIGKRPPDLLLPLRKTPVVVLPCQLRLAPTALGVFDHDQIHHGRRRARQLRIALQVALDPRLLTGFQAPFEVDADQFMEKEETQFVLLREEIVEVRALAGPPGVIEAVGGLVDLLPSCRRQRVRIVRKGHEACSRHFRMAVVAEHNRPSAANPVSAIHRVA